MKFSVEKEKMVLSMAHSTYLATFQSSGGMDSLVKVHAVCLDRMQRVQILIVASG